MNTSLLSKEKVGGNIKYMQYDTDTYHIDEIASLNVKNVDVYLRMPEGIKKEEASVKPIEAVIEFRMSRLAQVVFKLLYQEPDDTDDGDCFILLDEVAKLKSIIEIKYKLELGIEKYREYINNLYILENELRNRIAILNYQRDNIEEKGFGR